MAIYTIGNRKGKYHDNNARLNVLGYVLQESKTPHHCCRGYGFRAMNKGGELFHEYCARVMTETAEKFNKDWGVRLHHFMLGFQVKELRDPHTANEIANRLALYFCYKYETVYAVHEDTDNLNIHIVINSVSYVDGKKYGGTRQEFHAFKAYMGKVLGEYGIDVYYVPNDENQN